MGKAVAKKPTAPAKRAARPTATAVSAEFHPDYSYVRADLRRIAILAGALLSLLIILSFLVD